MVYESEFWAVNKKIEQRINVAEVKILREINGVTRDDKIRNMYIICSIGGFN